MTAPKPMLTRDCDYCGLPTPNAERFHEICADEVSETPLSMENVSSCPDGGCPACDPDPDALPTKDQS